MLNCLSFSKWPSDNLHPPRANSGSGVDHTVWSDIVTFTNVGGVATVTFLSDTDLSTITGSGLPILGQFTEGSKQIFISLALGNGNFLRTRICSNVNETRGCSGTSESISLSRRSSGSRTRSIAIIVSR
jgi:hypothetical protein